MILTVKYLMTIECFAGVRLDAVAWLIDGSGRHVRADDADARPPAVKMLRIPTMAVDCFQLFYAYIYTDYMMIV